MKRSISLLLLLLCFIPPIINYWPSKPPTRPKFHDDCESMNKTQSLNYLGTNLTLTSEDYENLLLCPGDAIGDLNATYVKIQDCNLTMYHKDKIIWSKGREDSLILKGKCSSDDYCFCIFSLKGDGNLVLHQDEIRYPGFRRSDWSEMNGWETYYPTRTELKLKDEQLQIIRTFSDGTQRLFYLDENHQGFTEDLGEPIKKADKFIIKNHSDPDKMILRRNEYIGDLNGTHLILQPNCKLQLLNKNKTIWSFAGDLRHDVPCTLEIAQDNTIQISKRWMDETLSEDSVMGSDPNLKVVESKITFSDREPIIIQTLKNGSELTFYGGRLKRELIQIAQDAKTIPRMSYVGNLTGLHLILEHNCSLMLVNGDEKLWEFQRGPRDSINAALECSVELEGYGDFLLFIFPHEPEYLLERSSSLTEYTGVKLTLENDQIVVKRKRRDRVQPDIFYAGRQTNGTFYQFIAQNSIVVNHTSSYIEILPRMGYIGDLNGVYALLDQNCNLVLYNKTQLLWESGAFLDQTSIPWDPCGLGVGLHDDMQVKISALTPHNQYNDREALWSAMDFKPNVNFGQLLRAELSIVHNELWLVYTFQDGTVNREKASQGTNHFTNNLAQFQPQPHNEEEKMVSCMGRNANHPLNYRGTNLTSYSNDPQDVVLYLGDTFGDLNETYVTLEFCYLIMYHKDKRIWSSNAHWPLPSSEDCVFSLERDGNLVLYGEVFIDLDPGGGHSFPWRGWDSQTIFNPVKSELTIQDQQVKMIQTFGDGTQRIFYGDANHQEFREHLGEPTKVAEKFIIKNHSDPEKTILRRNEYIGDLNGTHLILQPNCQLQLLNKNKTIWSFIPPFRHSMNCTLNVAQDGTIEISRALPDIKVDRFDEEKRMSNNEYGIYGRENLIKHPKPLEVIESQITFEGDQSMIIQTLKNGTKLTFCGMPGQNSGLCPKRELTQIASKTIILRNEVFIKRMDYIGNLIGLHLILEQNCSLILANGNKKLWELQSEPNSIDDPLMECLVTLYPSGKMTLTKEFVRESKKLQHLFKYDYYAEGRKASLTEVRLTLENDQIIVKKERSEGRPDIFYAGPKTNGYFFEFLAERSVIINFDRRNFGDILPKMGYIGDLNGIYTMLDQKCNWALYNKTQVLWESGTYVESGDCSLYQSNDGGLMMTGMRESRWSSFDSSAHKGFFNKLLNVEVLVKNDELWLIYMFRDGAIYNYKAITGTNHFELVSKEYEKSFGLEL